MVHSGDGHHDSVGNVASGMANLTIEVEPRGSILCRPQNLNSHENADNSTDEAETAVMMNMIFDGNTKIYSPELTK